MNKCISFGVYQRSLYNIQVTEIDSWQIGLLFGLVVAPLCHIFRDDLTETEMVLAHGKVSKSLAEMEATRSSELLTTPQAPRLGSKMLAIVFVRSCLEIQGRNKTHRHRDGLRQTEGGEYPGGGS